MEPNPLEGRGHFLHAQFSGSPSGILFDQCRTTFRQTLSVWSETWCLQATSAIGMAPASRRLLRVAGPEGALAGASPLP